MLINRYLSILFLLLFINIALAQDEIVKVFKNGKCAVMDTSLNLLVPYQFDDINIVNKKYFIVKLNGYYGLFDKTNKQILPIQYQSILSESTKSVIVKQQNLFGICDFDGKELIGCKYDSIVMLDSNFAILKKQDQWQYFNLQVKGISGNYDKISKLGEFYFLLQKGKDKSVYFAPSNSHSSYYTQIDKIRNNLFFCLSSNNQRIVLYNKQQFQIFQTDSFYFKELNSFVFAFRNNYQLHIIDENSINQVDIDADEIYPPFSLKSNVMASFIAGNYYFFERNGKKGLLDDRFKIIIEAIYDEIELTNSDLLLSKNGKKGLASINGEIVVPVSYDHFSKSGNYWIVESNNKFGLVDEKGREFIKPQYEKIQIAYLNRFIVTLKGKEGLVDENNKVLIPIEYQSVIGDANALILKRDSKYGLAKPSGDFILEVKYTKVSKINDQYFSFSELGKLGIISARGSLIAKAQYNRISATDNENIFYVLTNRLDSVSTKEVKEKFELDIDVPRDDKPFWWFNTGIINSFGEILLEPRYYKAQISIDTVTNIFIVKEKASVIIISFEQNGKLIEKTEYKNYLSIKKGRTQAKKNYWKQGGEDNNYGLFSPTEIKLIDYQYKFIKQNFLNNPDLVLTTGVTKGLGIVNEQTGKILLANGYKFIHTEDFKYSRLARCIKKSGAIVLIDTLANIIEKGVSYMDNFRSKYTRINKGGKVIISTNSAYMLPKEDLDGKENIYIDFERIDFKVCAGGNWGVMDTTGAWIIQPKYQFLQNYFRGVFIAVKDKKWGVVTPTDEQIIEFKYDEIRFFTDTTNKSWSNIPFYQARIGKKWGVIDKEGNMVIKNEFDGVQQITFNGKIYFKTLLDNKSTLFGLIDKEAKEVLSPQFLNIGPFINGFARVQTIKRCWKFINIQITILPTDCFSETRDFKNKLAAVKTKKGWGFIDGSGVMVIPAQYIEVKDFDENLASVKVKEAAKLFGLIKSRQVFVIIDKHGKIVYNTRSAYCSEISNGQMIIKRGKKLQVITVKGKKVLPKKYNQIIENKEVGLFIVQNAKRQFAIFNRKGKLIVPFGKYRIFTGFSEGLCNVEGEKKGFIDTSGIFKFELNYQKVGYFNCGLAAVKIKNKWGYIDTTGKIVISPQYENAKAFNHSIAEVMDDQLHWSFIDNMGKILAPMNEIDSAGYYIITKNGRKGIANQAGNIIVNPVAEDIGLFNENYAPFGIQKKFGLFDIKGNQLAESKYMIIDQTIEGLIRLENLGEINYIK